MDQVEKASPSDQWIKVGTGRRFTRDWLTALASLQGRQNMSNRKKELKESYKQNRRPMGIFQIRNLANSKVLIGMALDLQGILNSQKFQLSMGGHPNKALQADWREFGAESFVFEILDELPATTANDREHRAELAAMLELWLEKLEPYGDRGYNQKKVATEDRLRLSAQNRSGKQ